MHPLWGGAPVVSHLRQDADLIGAPYRLVVSPKNLEAEVVEFKSRDGSRQEMIPAGQVLEFVSELLA